MNKILEGILAEMGAETVEHHERPGRQEWTVSFRFVTDAIAFQDACVMCGSVIYVSDVVMGPDGRPRISFIEEKS